MNIKNFVQFYPNLLEDEECDKIIEWFEDDAEIIDTSIELPKKPDGSDPDYKYGRRTFSAPISRGGKFDDVFYDLVSKALDNYSKLEVNPLNWYPMASKNYCVVKFRKNEGVWREHIDDTHGVLRDNLLTIIAFLSDCDEDGELTFTQLCKEFNPQKGGVLVFPSSWMCGYEIKQSSKDRWMFYANGVIDVS